VIEPLTPAERVARRAAALAAGALASALPALLADFVYQHGIAVPFVWYVFVALFGLCAAVAAATGATRGAARLPRVLGTVPLALACWIGVSLWVVSDDGSGGNLEGLLVLFEIVGVGIAAVVMIPFGMVLGGAFSLALGRLAPVLAASGDEARARVRGAALVGCAAVLAAVASWAGGTFVWPIVAVLGAALVAWRASAVAVALVLALGLSLVQGYAGYTELARLERGSFPSCMEYAELPDARGYTGMEELALLDPGVGFAAVQFDEMGETVARTWILGPDHAAPAADVVVRVEATLDSQHCHERGFENPLPNVEVVAAEPTPVDVVATAGSSDPAELERAVRHAFSAGQIADGDGMHGGNFAVDLPYGDGVSYLIEGVTLTNGDPPSVAPGHFLVLRSFRTR
jgi:hypothetical protein